MWLYVYCLQTGAMQGSVQETACCCTQRENRRIAQRLGHLASKLIEVMSGEIFPGGKGGRRYREESQKCPQAVKDVPGRPFKNILVRGGELGRVPSN